MSPIAVNDRLEHLQHLAQFCADLAEAVNSATASGRNCRQAVASALATQCVQCGLRLTGSEMLELGETAKPGNPDTKLGRLRQGYCGRKGCDSYYYCLTFETHPEVEWTELLSPSTVPGAWWLKQPAADVPATKSTRPAARRRLAAGIGACLLAFGVVWFIRQWYVGGTIPFLREPENFQVDRTPSEQAYPGIN